MLHGMDISMAAVLVAVGAILAKLFDAATRPAEAAVDAEISRIHNPAVQLALKNIIRGLLAELEREKPAIVAGVARYVHVPANITGELIDSVETNAPSDLSPSNSSYPKTS